MDEFLWLILEKAQKDYDGYNTLCKKFHNPQCEYHGQEFDSNDDTPFSKKKGVEEVGEAPVQHRIGHETCSIYLEKVNYHVICSSRKRFISAMSQRTVRNRSYTYTDLYLDIFLERQYLGPCRHTGLMCQADNLVNKLAMFPPNSPERKIFDTWNYSKSLLKSEYYKKKTPYVLVINDRDTNINSHSHVLPEPDSPAY